MANYDKLARTALRLITANGKTAVFNKLSKTPADPDKPWRGPATPTVAETQTEAVVELGPDNTSLDFGKIIKKDDIPDEVEDVWLVARTPGNADLEDYDHLVCEGVTHKIKMLIRLRPGTVTLLYVVGTCR